MKSVVVLMVLACLGGAVMASESESDSFPPFQFSLLEFTLAPPGPPPETAWLLLADQHNMGPLADPSAPVQRRIPPALELSGVLGPQPCVCERCPALYWDSLCPVCGRYVPGPEEPIGVQVSWPW